MAPIVAITIPTAWSRSERGREKKMKGMGGASEEGRTEKRIERRGGVKEGEEERNNFFSLMNS